METSLLKFFFTLAVFLEHSSFNGKLFYSQEPNNVDLVRKQRFTHSTVLTLKNASTAPPNVEEKQPEK